MKKFGGFLLLILVVAAHLLPLPSHGARAEAPAGSEFMACAQVAGLVGECLTFLTGVDQKPLPSCCNGVLRFTRSPSVLQDKRLACRCFQRAISTFRNIREDALLDLPSQCHVELSISSKNC